MFIGRITLIECFSPGFHCDQDLFGVAAAQFTAGTIARAILWQLEILEQFSDGHPGDFGGLHQRSCRIGDAENTTMRVVTIWVTGIVLHVADKCVVPIGHVQRAVRGKLHIHGAKITIVAHKQIVPIYHAQRRTIIEHTMLFGALESDGVVDQHITLHFVWKMTTGDKLQTGSRPHLVLLQQVPWLRRKIAVLHVDRRGQHPAQFRTRGVSEKVLAPFIKSSAPRIRDRHATDPIKFFALWAIAKEPAVGTAHGAVSRFHV